MNQSEMVYVNIREILYRAIHKKLGYQDGKVTATAFIPKSEHYCSVDRLDNRTEQETILFHTTYLKGVFGSARISVRDCMDVGVSVIEVPIENNEYHSGIFSSSNPYTVELSHANELAERSVFVAITIQVISNSI
jgi:hypothetical protein